ARAKGRRSASKRSSPWSKTGSGSRAEVSATQSYKGIGASPGVAVGHAYVLDNRRVRTPKVKLQELEVEAEALRFKTAVELSSRQLEELKEKLQRDADEGGQQDHGLILDAHKLMMQ